jgi:hypothetical protein
MTRVLAALFAAFLPSAVAAQQQADINTAETAFSVPVSGAVVDVSVKTSFSSQHIGSNVSITGSSILDLSDLQGKLPEIVARFDLPHNSCQRFADDNVVASPQRGALVLANNTPTLSISGLSSVWVCLQNPVPETKVVWSAQQIAPGVQTKVPTVVILAGAPIKSKLMDVQFEWAAPLVWTQSGKMQAGGGTITLKGTDGDQNTKNERKVQRLTPLSASLADQVNMIITPLFDAKKIVPTELAEKHPVIESVEWINKDGHLAAKVRWGATIPADQETPKNP